MDRFEDTAFAGLSRDQYCIMWVRHSHAGHHELHFITPRVELSTGKSLNIRPPGKETQKLFDALRSEINTRYGLADPDDPARARNVRIPDYELKIAAEKLRNGQEPEADIRKLLDNLFTQRAAHGTIKIVLIWLNRYQNWGLRLQDKARTTSPFWSRRVANAGD